jgi:hypothetical protein
MQEIFGNVSNLKQPKREDVDVKSPSVVVLLPGYVRDGVVVKPRLGRAS